MDYGPWGHKESDMTEQLLLMGFGRIEQELREESVHADLGY